MKSEVIRPRRWSPSRLLIAVIIAYTGWSLSRVLDGLERADRQAEMRGPCCTGTEYYEPAPVVPECRFGRWLYDGRGFEWRCGP